jgi:hypothetical protein
MSGLDEWLPKEPGGKFFGTERRLLTVLRPFAKKQTKLEILWLNLKRFIRQRWKYYD